MGRTSSKINKRLEDIIRGNTLPRCSASKAKKADSGAGGPAYEPVCRLDRNICHMSEFDSLSESLDKFSDVDPCNDSGFYEQTGSITGDLNESLNSSLTTVQELPGILPLRPLYFEVPGDNMVRSREEVMDKLKNLMKEQRGAVITGTSGAGKTSILLDMVVNSHFGRPSSPVSDFYKNVVGYHFMHHQDPTSLDLAQVLHSLAAQLTQHPALTAYRQHLLDRPDLAAMLSKQALRKNPGESLVKAILDPLQQLYKEDMIEVDQAIILIDGLDEQPVNSDSRSASIAEFFSSTCLKFPKWLKLILTHRSNRTELTQLMGLPYVNLDLDEEDIIEYIESRIFTEQRIMSNIVYTDERRKNRLLVKLVNFITEHADGSFLYAKLILDLIAGGQLIIKSESFSAVPHNLKEVFTLLLNLRFPSVSSFATVSQIFSASLASTRPRSLAQIYRILEFEHGFNRFKQEYSKVANLLVTRSDGSLMFLHREFSDWLQDPSNKFHSSPLDIMHNKFVGYFSSLQVTSTNKTLDFIYHLAHCTAFEQTGELVTSADKKFLFLTYKVDDPTLNKVNDMAESVSFMDQKCLDLLKLALKTKSSS